VISRSSTDKYKSKPEDLKTVANELGAAIAQLLQSHSWNDSDELIARSQKGMMANPHFAVEDARNAAVFAI